MRCLGHRADYNTRCDCSLLPGAPAPTGLAGVVVQTALQLYTAHSSCDNRVPPDVLALHDNGHSDTIATSMEPRRCNALLGLHGI